MPRAALYTRVSSVGQARDGYSLEYQREILREFCEREGVAVHGVYEDGGRSGSTTEREGLRRLIADAGHGRFDTVLIFRVDRFSRDPVDLLTLVQELSRRSIRLRSVTEAVDANDPAGELMLTILGAIGKFVRQNIIQNAMLGKRKRAQTGRYTGGRVPFGYAVAEGGVLHPDRTAWWGDKSAADVALMMFELYRQAADLGRGGAAAVADRLNAMGVPAPETVWNAASVAQMLRNPVYAGDFAYNKRSHNLNRPSEVNEPGKWVVVRHAHEAIVDRALWERIQALRLRNRRGGRRPAASQPHLLASYIRCATCGSALTPRRSGDGAPLYYTCASRYNYARRRDAAGCTDFPYVPVAELEALVWGFVVRLATRTETVHELLARQRDESQPRLRQAEKDLAAAQRSLDSHDAQEMRITTAFAEGKLPEELWLNQLDRLRRARQRLTERIATCREAVDDLLRQPALALDADAIQGSLSRALAEGEMDLPDRRRALSLLIGERGIRVSKTGEVDMDVRIPMAPDPGGGESAHQPPSTG